MTFRDPHAAERRAAVSRHATRQEIRETVQRLLETPAKERPVVFPVQADPAAEATKSQVVWDETLPTAPRRKRSQRQGLWRRTWETARAECGLNLARVAHWLAQLALRIGGVQ